MCHMTLQNHLTEESLNFMSGSSLLYVHHPVKFVDHKYQGSRDKTFLVFHLRSHDQSVMGLYELELLKVSHHRPSFVEM